MKQETKFNYGFLLVGLGFPLVADYFLGRKWGVIAAIVVTVIGALLLISGHQHHEKGEPAPQRSKTSRAGIYILVGVLLSGGAWGVMLVVRGPAEEEHTKTDSEKKEPRPNGSKEITAPPQPSAPKITISLRFKDSHLFTKKRKILITEYINKMDIFLRKAEVDVPSDLPRIGINTQAVKGTGPTTTTSIQSYQESIDIPINGLDDPTEITLAYSQYVTWKVLFAPAGAIPEGTDVQEYFQRPEQVDRSYREQVGWAFPTYLNWSFWNRKGESAVTCPEQARWNNPSIPWPVPADFFWFIRQKYNPSFTDQLVAYTLKEMRDNPHTDPKEGLHAYFITRLRAADDLIDNDHTRFENIEQIFKDCAWQATKK